MKIEIVLSLDLKSRYFHPAHEAVQDILMMLKTWVSYARVEIPTESVLRIETCEMDCRELPSANGKKFAVHCMVSFALDSKAASVKVRYVNEKTTRGWPHISFGPFQTEVAPQSLFDVLIGNVLKKVATV